MPDGNKQSLDEGQSLTEENSVIKTILVVEDDADIGEFLVQAILQETRHQAMLVIDGFQALKAIKQIKPNLFILDYQLPSMNGIELYDQLHTTKGLEDVPAIVISAIMPKHEIEKRNLVSMGKPLELGHLLQTIEELLA